PTAYRALPAQVSRAGGEGTVRGGVIPAGAWMLPAGLIAAIGAVAVLLGGGWRGYEISKRLRRRGGDGTGAPQA
ncbi:hypothetical protein, partial [Spongiactinospora gelatinilytica]|uniref:hypothetical protein n=1 Tax=Spongiactinospora gelatinilytica TaxID=2666298 RepID=UPI00131490BD